MFAFGQLTEQAKQFLEQRQGTSPWWVALAAFLGATTGTMLMQWVMSWMNRKQQPPPLPFDQEHHRRVPPPSA
jgi:hypothetical protein